MRLYEWSKSMFHCSGLKIDNVASKKKSTMDAYHALGTPLCTRRRNSNQYLERSRQYERHHSSCFDMKFFKTLGTIICGRSCHIVHRFVTRCQKRLADDDYGKSGCRLWGYLNRLSVNKEISCAGRLL